MKWVSVIALAVLHNALCAHFNIRVDPLVYLEQGLVRGERASDGDYSEFLGVRYGQVNLENPFGPSQPVSHQEGIYNAIDGSIKCPQINRDGVPEGDLDCLTLNIYVPRQASSRNPLPVLIWIHGGGFSHGYSGEFRPKYLVERGVVVVTINYRLGAYGFFCVDSPSIPCNQGLKDQYAAIKWVRTNIAAFGGNPYEMTLGGESAGSASVLYQLYSTKEKMFNKVIIQSDTPLSEQMFYERDIEAAIRTAHHLGYETDNTEKALEFLKKADPFLVVAAVKDLKLTLKPTKENESNDAILKSNPLSLSNISKVKNTHILIGHTSKEHKGILLEMYGTEYLKTDPFYQKIRDNFNLDGKELTKAAEIVRHFYIGDKAVSEHLISTLEDFDSDFIFNHPVQTTVTKLLKENSAAVYEYMFDYIGDSESPGAGHSSESKYLFQVTDVPENDDDQIMIDRMTTLWTNFVKFGNPTPEASDLIPVIWQPASLDSRPFMILDTDLRLDDRVYHDRMAFWDLFYDNYGKYHIYADN